jgi:hypothetical protein
VVVKRVSLNNRSGAILAVIFRKRHLTSRPLIGDAPAAFPPALKLGDQDSQSRIALTEPPLLRQLQ